MTVEIVGDILKYDDTRILRGNRLIRNKSHLKQERTILSQSYYSISLLPIHLN